MQCIFLYVLLLLIPYQGNAFLWNFPSPFGGGFPFGNSMFSNSMFDNQMSDMFNEQMAELNEMSERLALMGIYSSFFRGEGGITIRNYGDITEWIDNGVSYVCDGQISFPNKPYQPIECQGNLMSMSKMLPPEKEVCMPGSNRMVVNDKTCIAFGNSHISMSSFNGNVICDGGTLYSNDKLRETCGPLYNTNRYVKSTFCPLEPLHSLNNRFIQQNIDKNTGCISWQSDVSGLNRSSQM